MRVLFTVSPRFAGPLYFVSALDAVPPTDRSRAVICVALFVFVHASVACFGSAPSIAGFVRFV